MVTSSDEMLRGYIQPINEDKEINGFCMVHRYLNQNDIVFENPKLSSF